MRLGTRLLLVTFLFGLLPLAALPGQAQQQILRLEVFNTKRPAASGIWTGGDWMAFCIEEETRDLNGDGDQDDLILCLLDLRNFSMHTTNIAIDVGLADDEEDWPIAYYGDQMVVQVSERENGGRDLNGNGKADDTLLALYVPATRKTTLLGASGSQPVIVGTTLYFAQPESVLGQDLNGDGDTHDSVLCSIDLTTRALASLGMDVSGGFQATGDWIAGLTSEAAQGGRDLNMDRDSGDMVLQLHQISQKKWVNTGFEASFGFELTPRLVAFGVDERKQGGADLNGNQIVGDTVCHVWDLAAGKVVNTRLECSNGLWADADVVGLVVDERLVKADLNDDGDQADLVAHAYRLGAEAPINLKIDSSGGMAATGGKLALAVSEADQKVADLNGDRDADDVVLHLYDPATNRLTNLRTALDDDLVAHGGYVAARVPEGDQGERDLNRDGDTDDVVLFVLDVRTGALGNTSTAIGDYLTVGPRAVGYSVPEEDQGGVDLNMNRSIDDELIFVARFPRR